MENWKKATLVLIVVALVGLPILGKVARTSVVDTPTAIREETRTKAIVPPPSSPPVVKEAVQVQPQSSGIIEQAHRGHRSGLAVTEAGTVSRLLSDDSDGSRHQRFIVTLASGHTVLIAHNIDIAPRINDLREGDRIEFSGIYEWNDKGGVVHWTHGDPRGRYAAGYLLHNGSVYQ